VVSYKETVRAESDRVCLSKSPNKHNRLFCKALPLKEELSLAIEEGKVSPMVEAKERVRMLVKEFEWDKHDA